MDENRKTGWHGWLWIQFYFCLDTSRSVLCGSTEKCFYEGARRGQETRKEAVTEQETGVTARIWGSVAGDGKTRTHRHALFAGTALRSCKCYLKIIFTTYSYS